MIRENNPDYLLVGNKVDVLGLEKAAQKYTGEDILFISAKDQLNIDLLKERLVDKVIQGISIPKIPSSPMHGIMRH